MVAGRHIHLIHRQFNRDGSILLGPGGQIVASDPVASPTSAPGPSAISVASVSQVAALDLDQNAENTLPAARIPSETLIPMVCSQLPH